jgi:hypothetical protein
MKTLKLNIGIDFEKTVNLYNGVAQDRLQWFYSCEYCNGQPRLAQDADFFLLTQ